MNSVILLVATKCDVASVNIANALLRNESWSVIYGHEETSVYACPTVDGLAFLWLTDCSLLFLNYANRIFEEKILDISNVKIAVTEIVFLSRHVASSGLVSVTIHPIGIPWSRNIAESGGIGGKCSPPSARIASLFSLLLQNSQALCLAQLFKITLEATHHGPYVDVPACFVEIGSSENEWDNSDAGVLWAACISQDLHIVPYSSVDGAQRIIAAPSTTSERTDYLKQLFGEWKAKHYRDKSDLSTAVSSIEESHGGSSDVLIMIGGGHYAPKINDLVMLALVTHLY
jgi:D-tyrosyl-tRNA(Tyr) deacylase